MIYRVKALEVCSFIVMRMEQVSHSIYSSFKTFHMSSTSVQRTNSCHDIITNTKQITLTTMPIGQTPEYLSK